MGDGGTDVGVFIWIESDNAFDRLVVGFFFLYMSIWQWRLSIIEVVGSVLLWLLSGLI